MTKYHGMPVEPFAHLVLRHLKKPHPKAYILVGQDAVELELMVKLLPVRWRDWLVRRQMGLIG